MFRSQTSSGSWIAHLNATPSGCLSWCHRSTLVSGCFWRFCTPFSHSKLGTPCWTLSFEIFFFNLSSTHLGVRSQPVTSMLTFGLKKKFARGMRKKGVSPKRSFPGRTEELGSSIRGMEPRFNNQISRHLFCSSAQIYGVRLGLILLKFSIWGINFMFCSSIFYLQ